MSFEAECLHLYRAISSLQPEENEISPLKLLSLFIALKFGKEALKTGSYTQAGLCFAFALLGGTCDEPVHRAPQASTGTVRP